jgi:hypothetical protein
MSRAVPQPVQSSKIPSARAIHMLRKLKRRSTKRERTRSHPIIYTVSYAASLLLGNIPWPGPRMRNGSNRVLHSANRSQRRPKCWRQLDGVGWWARYCFAPTRAPAASAMWRWRRRSSWTQWWEQPSSGFADRRMPTTYITRSMDPVSGSTADVLVSHLSEGWRGTCD